MSDSTFYVIMGILFLVYALFPDEYKLKLTIGSPEPESDSEDSEDSGESEYPTPMTKYVAHDGKGELFECSNEEEARAFCLVALQKLRADSKTGWGVSVDRVWWAEVKQSTRPVDENEDDFELVNR
jgi:hypothetical protein